MPDRRQVIKQFSLAALGVAAGNRALSFPVFRSGLDRSFSRGKPVRFGLISDLHHLQFGPQQKEEGRMKAFMDEVLRRSPDFIIQNGDFCRPVGSAAIMAEWNRFTGDKYHVLGNHDMDVCSKEVIMALWGMAHRYYSFDRDGVHFVIMDRNFLKDGSGALKDYDTANWSPLPSPFRSFSDAVQLEWLKKDLAGNGKPVVVFMHQPVYLTDYPDEIGNAAEILAIFDENNFGNAKGKIAAVFMGHDHDDRYGTRNGVHYFMMNSATYVYQGAPYYYKDSLFAFVTLHPDGELILEGRSSSFRDKVPDTVAIRFPTKISGQKVQLNG